jgi:hypothetical protein
MRNLSLGWAAAASILLAVAASADEYAYRHFEQPLTDTNRSNRIIYAPVGMAFSGPRPARQPFDVSVATWYQQSVGSRGARPDNVLDSGEYVLERFEQVPGTGMLRVVISRRGEPVQDAPELRVVDPVSALTTRAEATTERTADGVRYIFTTRPPRIVSVPRSEVGERGRYELRLMTARHVKLPAYLVRKPTFSGESVRDRMAEAPPRLPYQERVAGKRIEYRGPRSAGRIVDERVAGSREEIRRR